MAPHDGTTHITPENVDRVRRLIEPHVRRTPLLPSRATCGARGAGKVHLKCENLQVTSSFKVRGALSALLGHSRDRTEAWRRIERDGVVTGSSGNFAQGLAYAADLLGLRCTVVVPTSASPYKIAQIARYNRGAQIVEVPYERWREAMVSGRFPELPGFFLSSETDPYVSLGNATIAAEILDELPGLDAILVPFGGGNLAYSVASLVRRVRPAVRVVAVEVATGAPLGASLRAGEPVEVPYTRSFVDGIGASFVIPAQLHRLRDALSGAVEVSPGEIAAAVAHLALVERMIAEGAGAAALAAALAHAGRYGWRSPCAIVSGGVISPTTFAETLRASLAHEASAIERPAA